MIESDLNEFQIISDYLSGESVLALSRKNETNTARIQKILDNNHIPKVTQAVRNNPNLIEDYFNVIDSADKAYWVGLLLTDGDVGKEGDITLTLTSKDVHILELLEKDLGVINHVKPFGENYSSFVLGSKRMANDLSKYGIVPKSHYFRQRGKAYVQPYCELSFTGTYDMCENFQRVLLKYLDIPIKKISANHSIYRVRWGSVPVVLQICELLYADAGSHCLTRKYNLYQQLLEQSRVSA